MEARRCPPDAGVIDAAGRKSLDHFLLRPERPFSPVPGSLHSTDPSGGRCREPGTGRVAHIPGGESVEKRPSQSAGDTAVSTGGQSDTPSRKQGLQMAVRGTRLASSGIPSYNSVARRGVREHDGGTPGGKSYGRADELVDRFHAARDHFFHDIGTPHPDRLWWADSTLRNDRQDDLPKSPVAKLSGERGTALCKIIPSAEDHCAVLSG